ncbi:hypothetical protein TIFTF001_010882 [Ficus carica]|uniref:Transcription factor MYC/MYB N-terminal domain-containing protein n=1 Tax=Ficus carica TaxID=3494 RepID=A0AA88D093_FICCA|nr:hypothetical protein TIFTF001_010882 [Ficus carica]
MELTTGQEGTEETVTCIRGRILVWEDGFCNFAASSSSSSPTTTAGGGGGSGAAGPEMNGGDCSGPSLYGNPSSCDHFQHYHHQGLQPELFFKMSHEIYNYGEGLIGKVAADHSHKWIYKEPNDQEINFLSAWHNSADSHPRTWEAQFQSGIKVDGNYSVSPDHSWHFQGSQLAPQPHELYHDHLHHYNQLPLKITPSMSSLEALLSKLPSVVPPPLTPPPPPQAIMSMSPHHHHHHHHHQFQRPLEFMGSIAEKVAKDEIDDDDCYRPEKDVGGESSTSMSYRRHNSFHQHQDHNLSGF